MTTSLRSALDRLLGADLLFVEGAPARPTYRFKHALIQDAAYDSLLKSRRQALHRRAAEALRRGQGREPEAVAHHFTEAGLDDLAIEWWGKAGDQALRRSAFQEAIAHLGKAIAMADKAGATARRAHRRLGRSEPATDAVARRLRQRAHRRARLRRAGNDGSLRQSPRVGVRRQGRARTIGGRLRSVGRQLRAGRVAVDEGARSGLPQRRRGETRFARGRRRPSRRRGHLLVRRRVSRSAGSSRTRARLVPTRPRRRSGLSLRTGPRRRRDGLSGDCVVAARRGRSRDFAHRPHADADRGPHPCRHARVWKNARGPVRIDARRPRARRAERIRTRPPRARARSAHVARVRRVSPGLGDRCGAARPAAGSRTCAAASSCCANRTFWCSTGS